MKKQLLLVALLGSTPFMNANIFSNYTTMKENVVFYGNHGLAIAAGFLCLWGGLSAATNPRIRPTTRNLGQLATCVGTATIIAHTATVAKPKLFGPLTFADIQKAYQAGREDERHKNPLVSVKS